MEEAIVEVTKAGAALARVDRKIEALKLERAAAAEALQAASDKLAMVVGRRKGDAA